MQSQLSSTNAILEATCSNATDVTVRNEQLQQELIACKEKLATLSSAKEMMIAAQATQTVADEHSRMLQV